MIRFYIAIIVLFATSTTVFGAAMSSYQTKTTPVVGDKVLITDTQDGNKTKNATLGTLPGYYPSWMPSVGPTAPRQILQAVGGCSNEVYTTEATCAANSGTWTPIVYQSTSIVQGLINDGGSGTDDLLSAHEVDARILAGGGPTSIQMTFLSDSALVVQSGSKVKVPTGVEFTTADIGCDSSDTITFTLKKSATVNGAYTQVGTVSISGAAQNESIDISAWGDLSAGNWARIDLTSAGTTAKDCTVAIGGTEL